QVGFGLRFRCAYFGCRIGRRYRRREFLLKLLFQRCLHLSRHRRCELFANHSTINFGARAIAEQSVFGFDAVFHGLQHDFNEHALDLGCEVLGLQLVVRLQIRKTDFRNHMISSSACSAPAAFNASKIAIVSRGVTPSAFSARIRSSTVAPRLSVTKLLFCSSAVTFCSGTTTVCPCEKPCGCEIAYFVSTEMLRLPCAMETCAIETSLPIITVPVRSFTTTFAFE